jgi:TIR domain
MSARTLVRRLFLRLRRPLVFVSYRRNDRAQQAELVARLLQEQLGKPRVFFDTTDMSPGQPLRSSLALALRRSQAMIVVVGPNWAAEENRKRLDDESDWVRNELTKALARPGVEVVVLYIDGARVLTELDLPEPLHPLLDRLYVTAPPLTFNDTVTALGVKLEESVPRAWPRAVSASVAGVLLAASFGAYRVATSHPIPSMGGGVNVAIAGFSVEVGEAALGNEFAQRVAASLASQSGDRAEVWGPDRVGHLVKDDGASQLRWVQNRAKHLNADLVIYGAVRGGTKGDIGGVRVEPRVYIPPDQVSSVGEASGEFSLGKAMVLDPRNGAQQAEIARQLTERATPMSNVAIGIDALGGGDSDAAVKMFTAALAQTNFNAVSRSLILVLRGASYARAPITRTVDLSDQARADFEQALVEDPTDDRGQVGLAELAYRRSAADVCGERPGRTDVNVAELASAGARYSDVLAHGKGPPGADLGAKAAFGLGRVLSCQVRGRLSNDLARSRQLLQGIIDEYTHGNTRLAELAALAHVELGLLVFQMNLDPPGSDREIRKGLEIPALLPSTRCRILRILVSVEKAYDSTLAAKTEATFASSGSCT